MTAHLEYPALVVLPDVIGAGYVSAVLADDIEMQNNYLAAYGWAFILECLSTQLILFGNTLGAYQRRSRTEVGDSMVAGAFERARMGVVA